MKKRAKIAAEERKENLKLKNAPEVVEDNFGNKFEVERLTGTDLVAGLLGEKHASEFAFPPASPVKESVKKAAIKKEPDTTENGYKTPEKSLESPTPEKSLESPTKVPHVEGHFMALDLPYEKFKCDHCKYNPCIIKQFSCESADFVEELEVSGMPNNECRKEMYRFYYRMLYGPGRVGVRLELPWCATFHARRDFPKGKNEKYMGFKSSAKPLTREGYLELAEEAAKDVGDY